MMVKDPVVRGRGQVRGVAPAKMEKAAAAAVRAGDKDPDRTVARDPARAAAEAAGTIAIRHSKYRWEWR